MKRNGVNKDLKGDSNIGALRPPDEVGALLERIVARGVVGRRQGTLEGRQGSRIRKERSESQRDSPKRPTIALAGVKL